jgi:hypothetical protein
MATCAPARQHPPLGDDQLIPIALVANEPIGQPLDVYAVCQQGEVDPNTRPNQPCCITSQNVGSPVEYFHGIVQATSAETAVRGQAVVDQFQAYRLVPRTGPEVPDDQSRQLPLPPARSLSWPYAATSRDAMQDCTSSWKVGVISPRVGLAGCPLQPAERPSPWTTNG